MRAVVINEYGPSEKLTLVDLKEPSPRPEEVLIRVRAAGVNPVDWKIRSGKLKPVIDRVYPLDQARAAHDRSESERTRGKIVLEIG